MPESLQFRDSETGAPVPDLCGHDILEALDDEPAISAQSEAIEAGTLSDQALASGIQKYHLPGNEL